MTSTNQVELLIITIAITLLAALAMGVIIEIVLILNKIKSIASRFDHVLSDIEETSKIVKDATKKSASKYSVVEALVKVFNTFHKS